MSAFDPIRLAAITTVLAALVAILAGLFPALRAASVDPIQALRAEWFACELWRRQESTPNPTRV